MNIEKGMYVRSIYGMIGKVYHIETHKTFNMYYVEQSTERSAYPGNAIIKASYNIKDLIEEGDLVNGYVVDTLCEGKYINGYLLHNDEIKTILTHEQIKANSYKVGE